WPPGLSRASSRRVSFFIERLPSSSPAEKMIYYIFRLCYYVHRSNATSGPPDCAALEVRDQQFGCLSGVLRWKPAPRLRRKIEAAGSMSDRLDHACKQHGSEESQQCQHRSTTRAARLSSLDSPGSASFASAVMRSGPRELSITASSQDSSLKSARREPASHRSG